jgi:photosystem II stability/assembly factor-like uncharacterized protein
MTKKALAIHLLIALLIAIPIKSLAQWSEGRGLENLSVSSVVASHKNLIAGDWGLLYLSTDSGATWTVRDTIATAWVCPVCSIVTPPIATLFANDSEVFAGAGNIDSGNVHISTDNGITWIEKDSSFAQSINCFTMENATIFAGTNDGVYHSTDNGTHWSAINTGLNYGDYDSIYNHAPQVVCIVSTGTDLFAGTTGEGAFCSSDSGTTWTSINSGLTGRYVDGLASIGTNIFAAVFNAGVFYSSNDGTNWIAVNTGLTNLMVNTLIASDSNLYLGTNRGVFLSTNGGQIWTDMSTGTEIDSSATISLAVCNGYLFAGTNSNGVWRYPLSQTNTSVTNDRSLLPSQYALEQNYPNPFNPTTTIIYQLATNSLVKLEVYDMLGRKTETLVNEDQHAGVYSVIFNATSLTSGAYFYRITTNGFVQTKKLLVIK